MKKINRIVIATLIMLTAVFGLPHNKVDAATRISFIVVYPGSSSTVTEGKRMIGEFVKTISNATGIPSYRLSGHFFNSPYSAEVYMKRNPNCFIMGSMGFFLKNKYRFSLQPLAKISMRGRSLEQYHVLVKMGRYSSIRSLRHKKLGGSILKENNRYLTKIVFNNQIASGSFKLNKRYSTLRALKYVSRGRLDAAVVDNIEYTMIQSSIRNGNSMSRYFSKLKRIYSSPQYPALGFMMTNTGTTRRVKAKIMGTMSSICSLPQGRGVCKNFGISGFIPVKNGEMSSVIKKYYSR